MSAISPSSSGGAGADPDEAGSDSDSFQDPFEHEFKDYYRFQNWMRTHYCPKTYSNTAKLGTTILSPLTPQQVMRQQGIHDNPYLLDDSGSSDDENVPLIVLKKRKQEKKKAKKTPNAEKIKKIQENHPKSKTEKTKKTQENHLKPQTEKTKKTQENHLKPKTKTTKTKQNRQK